MASKIPRVSFNNGQSSPIIGLGTWQSDVKKVEDAVKIAIDCGYRHIDCAYCYENEHEVGNGIEAKIKDGTIKRSDLFITSKLWCSFFRPNRVAGALKKSLELLKLDYLDLYLMHWPVCFKDCDKLFPEGENGKMAYGDTDYIDTYKAMESLVDQGLVRSIGVSNFNIDQMKRLVDNCRIIPANLQIELHPLNSQKSLVDYCKSKGISVTAYSPLGNPTRPVINDNDPHLMSEPTVVSIAEKKKKSPAMILIRYHIQNGVIVIPKSITASRIESNIQVFDFELSAQEMEQLEKMNRDFRFLRFSKINTSPYYPFTEVL